MNDEQNAAMQIAWLESNNQLIAALALVADIRAAAGDPEGKMMQDEFIEHVRHLYNAGMQPKTNPILPSAEYNALIDHIYEHGTAAEGVDVLAKKLCAAATRDIVRDLEKLTATAITMQDAIEKTLNDNLHLADGEVCTLIDLKRALRGDFSPWTRIDYADPSTYPDESRPCIVAWEHQPEHTERHAMHIFNDVGGDMRLWQNILDDDVHDWDGVDENPTHWMYAPEYTA